MFKNKKIETYIRHQKIYHGSIQTIKTHIHKSERQSSNVKQPVHKFGLPPKKNLSSSYILYAKCLIDQLKQQIEIQVLDRSAFKTKVAQVLQIAKKINSRERGQIIMKIINLYLKIEITLDKNLQEFFKEGIKYLQKLSIPKLRQHIIFQRIDKLVLQYMANYSPIFLTQQCPFLVSYFSEEDANVKNKLTKSQIQQYQNNIKKIFNSTNLDKKVQKHLSLRRISSKKQQALSSTNKLQSRISIKSVSSESSRTFKQKISNFNKKKQRESFSQNLNKNAKKLRKKKSTLKIQSSKFTQFSKRISTRWGKNDLVNIQKQFLEYKGSAFVEMNNKTESQSSGSQGSIKDKATTTLFERIANYAESKQEKEEPLRKFCFFVQINEILRCLIIKKIDLQNSASIQKFTIYISGFITQVIPLKISNTLANNLKNQLDLHNFLNSSLSFQKVNFGFKFYSSRNAKSLEHKNSPNIIKETIISTRPKCVFSFIKKINVYFFAKLDRENKIINSLNLSKYESKQKYEKYGRISIYDRSFDELYEIKQTSISKNHYQSFEKEHQEEEEEELDFKVFSVEVIENEGENHEMLKSREIKESMSRCYKDCPKFVKYKKKTRPKKYQVIKLETGQFRILNQKDMQELAIKRKQQQKQKRQLQALKRKRKEQFFIPDCRNHRMIKISEKENAQYVLMEAKNYQQRRTYEKIQDFKLKNYGLKGKSLFRYVQRQIKDKY